MESRNLGFAEWRDPQAWMESMKGPGWRKILDEEARRFQEFVARTPATEFEVELSTAEPTEANGRFETEDGEVIVVPQGTLNYSWRYATSTEYHTCLLYTSPSPRD